MFASTPSFWVIACSSVSLNSSIFEVSGAWGAWVSRVGSVGGGVAVSWFAAVACSVVAWSVSVGSCWVCAPLESCALFCVLACSCGSSGLDSGGLSWACSCA